MEKDKRIFIPAIAMTLIVSAMVGGLFLVSFQFPMGSEVREQLGTLGPAIVLVGSGWLLCFLWYFSTMEYFGAF